MSTYPYLLTETVLIFAEAAACMLISVRGFEKKKGFAWKLPVLICLTLLVVFLFPYLYTFSGENALYLVELNYVFALVFIFGYFYFLFDMKIQNILFYSAVFLLNSFTANKITYIVFTAVQSSFDNVSMYYGLLIEALVYILVFAIIAVIFINRYRGRVEDTRKRFLLFFLTVFLCVSLCLSELTTYISDNHDSSYVMMLVLSQLFYALVMTIVLFYLLNQGETEAEIAAVKQLWTEDKKHYELQKESLEMINIKVHDLKHQLQDVKEAGELSEMTFSQLQESADIYQSIVQTGNEVLDVALSSASLRAQKEKILFTCMADGEALSFMEDSDIYSFFLNLLDNALEHEEKIGSDKERFISLTVKKKDGYLLIHEENLYSGETDKNDILETTKEDKSNHGIGTKSMRKIVEKYKGEINFLIQDGMFQVDVKIPSPEDER